MINKAVTLFLDELDHSLRPQIDQLRALILSADSLIEENIKWNGPNYHWCGQDFLSMRLQPRHHLQLIFHTGAKKPTSPVAAPLLKNAPVFVIWKGNDRAVVDLQKEHDFTAAIPHLPGLVKEWIANLSK